MKLIKHNSVRSPPHFRVNVVGVQIKSKISIVVISRSNNFLVISVDILKTYI